MTRRGSRVAALGFLAAALGLVAAIAVPLAANALPFSASAAPGPGVATATLDIEGVMPGDTLPLRDLDVPASTINSYRVRARVEGSDVLARTLRVHVESATSGTALYDGPVDAASFAGATGGEVDDRLTVRISCPAEAGNELQGQRLSIEWELTTIDVPPAARR